MTDRKTELEREIKETEELAAELSWEYDVTGDPLFAMDLANVEDRLARLKSELAKLK